MNKTYLEVRVDIIFVLLCGTCFAFGEHVFKYQNIIDLGKKKFLAPFKNTQNAFLQTVFIFPEQNLRTEFADPVTYGASFANYNILIIHFS